MATLAVLASWIESHGASGLLGLLQEHALASIDRGRDESIPDADETLLRIVADAVTVWGPIDGGRNSRQGRGNGAGGIQSLATQDGAGAAEILLHPRRPRKSGNRREYRKVTPEVLRRIQASYGIDLDFPEADGETDTV